MGKRKTSSKKAASGPLPTAWTPDQLVLSKLRAAVIASNLTQVELVKATGISQSRLSKIMSGEGRPFADQMASIIAAVNRKGVKVTLDWLMDDGQPEDFKPATSDDEQMLLRSLREAGMPADKAIAVLIGWRDKAGVPIRNVKPD